MVTPSKHTNAIFLLYLCDGCKQIIHCIVKYIICISDKPNALWWFVSERCTPSCFSTSHRCCHAVYLFFLSFFSFPSCPSLWSKKMFGRLEDCSWGLILPGPLVSFVPSFGHFSLSHLLQIPYIMSRLLFQQCEILLGGSTGIFSKGHLNHSLFS